MNETLLPHLRLQFNIEHPGLEECYAYGYECGKAELDEQENPFSENSAEYAQWAEGWWAGFYGEEPLYALTSQEELVERVQAQLQSVDVEQAANDKWFSTEMTQWISKVSKIAGALAATAVVGYQIVDMVV